MYGKENICDNTGVFQLLSSPEFIKLLNPLIRQLLLLERPLQTSTISDTQNGNSFFQVNNKVSVTRNKPERKLSG